MKKTALKPVKIARVDIITNETMHGWRHRHSEQIHSRVRVLRVEAEELEKHITGLTAALNNAREQQAKVEAQLRGLETVIERR